MIDPALEQRLRHKAYQDGVHRLVVGAVIIRKGLVLLLRRTPGDFMGGMWELPSGQVEENETIAEALRREVAEETGLRLQTVLSYLGFFDYTSRSGIPTRQWTFAATPGDVETITLHEHDDYRWTSLKEVHRCAVSAETRNIIDGALRDGYL